MNRARRPAGSRKKTPARTEARPFRAESSHPRPTFINHWVPKYVRLDTVGKIDAARNLLVSAALPFGIVPPVALSGRTCVDGGLVDNCPISPLLEHDVDEVFFLTLEVGDLDACLEPKRCAELARLLELSERPVPTDVHSLYKNDPPKIIPYPEFPRWLVIRTFAPAYALGGPLPSANELQFPFLAPAD